MFLLEILLNFFNLKSYELKFFLKNSFSSEKFNSDEKTIFSFLEAKNNINLTAVSVSHKSNFLKRTCL